MRIGCKFITDFIMDAILKIVRPNLLYKTEQGGAARPSIHPEGKRIGVVDFVSRLDKNVVHTPEGRGGVKIPSVDLSLELVAVALG
jgi:hypothetical protein